MNQMTPGENLSNEVVNLIAHITAPLGAESNALAQQAAAATITRSSSTMLDLAVPAELPTVNLDDGPTPGEALVYDGDQLVGELLVWVRSGRLIGLEQAWYTDDPPSTWPAPDRVRVT